MNMLRRVLLLLSVAVLLQEGSSNSPLDFLRDLKNRIFASSNTTEPTEEEPPVQCSGLDQDGVCASTKNGSIDESNNLTSTATMDNPELANGTQNSDPADMPTNDQVVGNETIDEETYNTNNTLYYDEQEWNNTATNNTDNYRNDIEYPENGQNETDFKSEAPAANGKRMSNQTENTRSKRQINKVEINITLKTPGAKSTPLTLSTTVLTGKSENSSNNSSINQTNNITGGKEDILNASKSNNTFSVQNESITTDENETVVMTELASNETRENIVGDGQKTNESINTKLDSSEDLVVLSPNDTISDFSKAQNTTDEIISDESTLTNCTDCVAAEESKDLQNTSLSLDKDVNGTESIDFQQGEINENSTQVNNNFITGLTNITKLKDILENSTRIIKKIVQNIIPAISEVSNETNAYVINDIQHENNSTQNMKMTGEQNNSMEKIKSSNTEIERGDKIDDRKLNSTIMLEDIISEGNTNKTTDTSNVKNTNIIQSHPLELNLNYSKALQRNITDYVRIKRARRSINFTILSEDDEESDFSVSTFPDATESPAAELPSSTMTNSTESSSWNGTQTEIEVVGPVCIKRYEQCANSKDCCEDYECIGTDENNSTSYCDLIPVNLTSPTSFPITEDNTE